MSPQFVVYKIINSVNNKVYVGQTRCGVTGRWNAHKSNAIRGYSGHLYNAMRKHGLESFSIEVVANALSLEYLNGLEICLIARFKSFEAGYNMTSGGECPTEVSEVIKNKIRASKIGEKNPFYGKTHSEQTKKTMSMSRSGSKSYNYGRKFTQDERRNMSLAQLGKRASLETKARMSKSHTGLKHSEATKGKIGRAQKGTKNHNYGKTASEDTRRLMSVNNTRLRGRVYTPFGVFDNLKSAVTMLHMAPSTISGRCNNQRLQWSDWHFEKYNTSN